MEYDSPWKDVLERLFQAAVELCFPAVAGQIQWSQGIEFLDKEFQKITRGAESGKRTVDKLAQVWRQDGAAEWVLVHVEIQAHRELDFAERMFDYYCRIRQRYHRDVASLAFL